jgi:long-subunit acyl-CoA synthetase (AMP-forming)
VAIRFSDTSISQSWYPDHVDTGDIGEVDAEGFVTVKGRSKNLLISSFGRNISPEWIESELVGTGSIRQVAVVGDGRPYCTALVFPLDENCAGNEIQAAIDETNATLPDYARIGNWSPLPEAMTASNSMLTANGRPRRDKIEQKYSQIIESMYCENKETRAT